MCYYIDDLVRSVVPPYGDFKQYMSARASLVVLQLENRDNLPSGTGNNLLHHNRVYFWEMNLLCPNAPPQSSSTALMPVG